MDSRSMPVGWPRRRAHASAAAASGRRRRTAAGRPGDDPLPAPAGEDPLARADAGRLVARLVHGEREPRAARGALAERRIDRDPAAVELHLGPRVPDVARAVPGDADGGPAAQPRARGAREPRGGPLDAARAVRVRLG